MGIAETTTLQRPVQELRQRLQHGVEAVRSQAWDLLRRSGLDLWHYDLGLDDETDRLVQDDLG